MLLEVRNVSKRYGNQYALKNVSFQREKPGIVGFLGPNGAGKSTMMKIITGYLPCEEGEVKVCELPVGEQSTLVKKLLGYLPEHNPLYVDMYVREFLEFCAKLYGVPFPMKKVNEMIGRVGLDREKHKKIGALSKGYRQRVGLAHAMIHDPKILILDEPTTGLDPNQVVEIRNLIKELSKDKLVIFSTHIMQEVEQLCNDVIIIHLGSIVAQGPMQWLKENTSGYVLELETEEQIAPEWFNEFSEIRKKEIITDRKIRLYASGSEDLRKKVFEFCVNRSLTILSLQKSENRMEDIFRELTQK